MAVGKIQTFLSNYIEFVETTASNQTVGTGYVEFQPTPPTLAGYKVLCLFGGLIATSSNVTLEGTYLSNNTWKIRFFNAASAISGTTIRYNWLMIRDI